MSTVKNRSVVSATGYFGDHIKPRLRAWLYGYGNSGFAKELNQVRSNGRFVTLHGITFQRNQLCGKLLGPGVQFRYVVFCQEHHASKPFRFHSARAQAETRLGSPSQIR